jgi:hypothetical protein
MTQKTRIQVLEYLAHVHICCGKILTFEPQLICTTSNKSAQQPANLGGNLQSTSLSYTLFV